MSLLAYGCPTQAIVSTYGVSEKTVRDWAKRAGEHCEGVHEQTVMRQHWDLQHIQADELKVTTQMGIVWVALVMMVSTRLWLGGKVDAIRGKDLIRGCLHYAARCALCRPLLLAVDGLNMYAKAVAKVFRSRQQLPGDRPRWFVWQGIVITQVIKKRGGKRGHIERIVLQGDEQLATALRKQSQGGQQINSAQARHARTLTAAIFLQGCVYNFCTDHDSLALDLQLPRLRHRWIRRTPAMVAGLTDHRWSVDELLRFNRFRDVTGAPPFST